MKNVEPYELSKSLEGENWIYELVIKERGENYEYILKAEAKEGYKYDGSIPLGWIWLPEGVGFESHRNALYFESDMVLEPKDYYDSRFSTGISPENTNIIFESIVSKNYFEKPNTDFWAYIIYDNQLKKPF